ncbi:MAG: hypothetical protein ACJAYU_000226 [Bradymonadia bacterium]|jgi:hypothetical protein
MKKAPLIFSALSLVLFACGTSPGEDEDVELDADVATDGELDTVEDVVAEDVVVEDAVVEDAEPEIGPADVSLADTAPSDVEPADTRDTSDVGCPDGPEWQYESDEPASCAEIGLTCEFPGNNFANECGCGCFFPRTPDCSFDELGPLYQEAGSSPADCAAIFFVCEDGGEAVQDDCGCGCVYGPPICLDPDAVGVSYVGQSPQECELIDFECGSARYFNNPCGCGCIVEACPTGPAVDYAATSADDCAEIDFGCPDGWTGFDAGECGCGCEIASCETGEFLPPSGLASNIELGGFCDFLVACSQFSLGDGGMSDPFNSFYPDARCREGTSSGCPAGTESVCEIPLMELGPDDLANACAITQGEATTGMLCSGDR